MPAAFKKHYPNTRVIIDAAEFRLERPSSLLSQSCTFSAYKNTNTVKVFIGVIPSEQYPLCLDVTKDTFQTGD